MNNEIIIDKKYLFSNIFDENKFRNNSFYNKLIFSHNKKNIFYNNNLKNYKNISKQNIIFRK
jgi:hypothetical protein